MFRNGNTILFMLSINFPDGQYGTFTSIVVSFPEVTRLNDVKVIGYIHYKFTFLMSLLGTKFLPG